MDILQYINKMNRLYGNDSTPVRFNTQKYLQGGRVGYQSGQLVQPGPGRQGYAGTRGTKMYLVDYSFDEMVKDLNAGKLQGYCQCAVVANKTKRSIPADSPATHKLMLQ